MTAKVSQMESNLHSPVYNFGAGPACLPIEVLQQIRDDIPNWYDGMSVMELSHRLPVMVELTAQIEKNLRSILAIPDEFVVLFMHGGARAQFSLIPLNLLNGAVSADYLVTGHWSKLAYQDAKQYCTPNCVATSEPTQFTMIPPVFDWTLSEKGPYFHYTDNETIHGVEFATTPSVSGKWLISDMTSSILTKPIDFSRYGLIYASAQKNLGIAGLTLVIVRKELIGHAHPLTPYPFNYEVCANSHSMSNTPPVFCWYVTGLMVQWALAQGLEKLENDTVTKSKLIYEVIDQSDFYHNQVNKADRSRLTIPFQLPTPELTNQFLLEASQLGLKQLKGHKLVGGVRACVYNAMPIAGVQALAEFMQVFQNTHS